MWNESMSCKQKETLKKVILKIPYFWLHWSFFLENIDHLKILACGTLIK